MKPSILKAIPIILFLLALMFTSCSSKKCSNCGFDIDNDAAFCSNCGTSAIITPTTEETEPSEEPTPTTEETEPSEEYVHSEDEWGYGYYVDYQFGEETDDWFVTTLEPLDGTFENSATEDSLLLAEILYDCDDEISIFLYEYADTDNLVKNNSADYKDYYKIVIKNDKGTTYEARGQMWPGGDRIFIIDTYHSTVLDMMKTSSNLRFFIQSEDSPATQYRFDVDMNNFNEAVNDAR